MRIHDFRDRGKWCQRDRDERETEREENVLSLAADIPACDTVEGAMSKMKMECWIDAKCVFSGGAGR